MSAQLDQEYQNLIALEKELSSLAKNEFIEFVKSCNGYIKSEDLKDEFEKSIKLLKTLNKHNSSSKGS